MARQRITATELARLLADTDRPIYALDRQGTIIYASPALGQWLDIQPANLVGGQCVYRSLTAEQVLSEVRGEDNLLGDDGPHGGARPLAAMLADLTPPPEVFTGRPVTADVVRQITPTRFVYRTATFTPVPLREVPFLVLAVLDQTDHDEPLPVRDESYSDGPTGWQETNEAVHLHNLIRQFRQTQAARAGADWLVGESPAMRLARQRFSLAARSSENVLIAGPEGVGRRRTAEAIHYGRPQAPLGALIPLDCRLLGPEVIPIAMAAGKMDEDDDGHRSPRGQRTRSTLLFRDIEQLDLPTQIRLLTLIEEGPVGNLRLMATTEQPTDAAIDSGEWIEPLAVRFSTLVIDLPPLCQRMEDLPALVQMVIESTNRSVPGEEQLVGAATETLDRLAEHDWPGEIRELLDVVTRAFQQADGPILLPEHLPTDFLTIIDAKLRPIEQEESIQLDEFLRSIEQELVARALRAADGNKAKAARLLGVSRPRLYRLAQQHGLAASDEEEPLA